MPRNPQTLFVFGFKGRESLSPSDRIVRSTLETLCLSISCLKSARQILLEKFLEPMGLSQYRLAAEIGVPAQRISTNVTGQRFITADTDLRLCRFFGLSDGYWLRAQAATRHGSRRLGLVPTLAHIIKFKQYFV